MDNAVGRRRMDTLAAWLGALVIGAGAALVLVGDYRELNLFTVAPLVAVLCTGLTLAGALRRMREQGRWVGPLIVGMVVPPSVLFLPTLFGIIYAALAGLVALGAVTPLVMLWHRAAPERRWLVLAAWSALMALFYAATLMRQLAIWPFVPMGVGLVALALWGIGAARRPGPAEDAAH